MKQFVPHDQLTEGLWYLRTNYAPGYTVVSLTRYVIGPNANKIGVWMIDKEGSCKTAAFDEDQFISPVPSPFTV